MLRISSSRGARGTLPGWMAFRAAVFCTAVCLGSAGVSCGQWFSSTCADGMPGDSSSMGVATCCGIDCKGPFYNPCSECSECRSPEVFEGKEIGPEFADVPLLEFPFLKAHDAGTGYAKSDTCNIAHRVNDFTITQPMGGFIRQLDCGARAFDVRPVVVGDDIFFHHGEVKFHTKVADALEELKAWSARKPATLLLIELANCAGPDCWDRVFQLLEQKGIRLLHGSEVSSFTMADAQKEGLIVPGGGSIVAVSSKRVESNYDPAVPYKFAGPGDFINLFNGMDAACNFDGNPKDHYGGKLWMIQAHWQYDAARVAKGVATGTCILKDESGHQVNRKVAAKIADGACKHLNLVEVDDVCDGGAELFEALRTSRLKTMLAQKYERGIAVQASAASWLGLAGLLLVVVAAAGAARRWLVLKQRAGLLLEADAAAEE